MDLQTRIIMVQLFYSNGFSASAALRCFKTKNKLVHDPFTIKSVANLIKKFEKFGVVTDLPKTGRPGVSNELIQLVKETNEIGTRASASGCFSSVQISRASGIPQSTVLKVLHQKLLMRPYHLKTLHKLHDNDYAPRIHFADWFLDQEDPQFSKRVLWSDEAHFYLDGYVCSNQCVIWDSTNPHKFRERPLHPLKVTVWCAFNSNFILPPYFIDSPTTVNQYVYADIINNHLMPHIQGQNDIIFMQDGATAHTANSVKALLLEKFGEHNVISRGFTHSWPSRSPDLNPCDYFLWGFLKSRVFRNSPRTLEDLKMAISHEINQLTPELLGRSIENIYDRLLCVIGEQGGHIEQ